MADAIRQMFRPVIILYFVTSVIACPHNDVTLSRWSDSNTWPDNKLPEAGTNVSITGNVLLDMSPPPLFGVTVETNGKLVWSPEGDFTMIANFIHLKGELHIGSETCPFEANARISLTGDRQEYSVPKFGQKFVGVDDGGTLEIHGKKKLAWTKLAQTVPRLEKTNGLIFSSTEDRPMGYHSEGLAIYTFNDDGGLYKHKVYSTSGVTADEAAGAVNGIVSHLSGIPDGKLVMMAVQYTMVSDQLQVDLSPVFAAIETIAGIPQGQGQIRRITRFDAYSLVAVKGDPTKTMETLTPVHHYHQIAESSLEINGLKMVAISKTTSKQVKTWENHRFDFRIVGKDASVLVLDLVDDVSSWKEGDRLLLTSTDYSMEKAEVATIVRCTDCSSKQVKVALLPKFMHYSGVENNVDMRGEVALLSRNIVIEGVMNAFCPTVNENCNDYDFDTFGGHVKAVKGFKNVHIEGAEFYHLGKQTDLGHYPIHFHMCEDVDGPEYPNPPYIRDNSIHHTFARCVTVHGTHGLTVMDNVGYESLGHCYFLEDGGEKRTVFDGNLGASTRYGKLIPSDAEPTTFWITNPNTILRNNVAAGSERKGYWFIYPDIPLAGSATKGYMQREEARHTAITEFTNNVAHSNKNGFFLDNRLDENTGAIISNNFYHPRENPLDENSANKHVIIDRLTAYQNARNAWVRGGWITLTRASLAGSQTSLILVGSWNLKQFLSKSVVLGETDNIGDPDWGTGVDGWKMLPHSLPQKNYNLPIQGVAYYDGPSYVFDTFFGNFTTNQNRKAGALGFKRNNKFSTPSISGTKNIKFGFSDGILTGNRVYDGNSSITGFADFDGDIAAKFVDLDGTVTTIAESSVVRSDPYMITSQCTFRDSWNLVICPHRYIEMNFFVMSAGDSHLKPYASRDDVPESPRHLTPSDFVGRLSMIADGKHSYSVHWADKSPSEYQIMMSGMDKRFPIRIGFCLPRNAKFNLFTWYPTVSWGIAFWTEVNSIQEIDDDTVGGKYYFNSNTGMLYVKMMTPEDRAGTDYYDCQGKNCPNIRIRITEGDLTDADCSQRDTPTPPAQMPVMEKSLNQNSLSTYYSAPDQDWGAGLTVPFATRQVVDGQYSNWTEWGECSALCGGGQSVRIRACDNPSPKHGGKDCVGPSQETKSCNAQHCHDDIGGPFRF
ncbi:cell surface hyaluronidase-like isoform X2 [Pecten maximus]|uniref:cell surface hyaluronidase-like isoform X2 n=1 Tax=Pecten maximus TaxID=6579 RepID=UPI001458E8B8|nr:cell surface hyaluronidase-like isoform X2 [Pecten maximus]